MVEVSGETTLFGHVNRIDDSEHPKILFKLIGRQDLICCDAAREIVIEAAKRLNQEVGIKGFAVWNTETSLIKTFRVGEILEYEKTDITTGFGLIREKFGAEFNHIGDIDVYIASLRGD